MRGVVGVLALAAAAAMLAPTSAQDLIAESSFLPPFEEFDVDGTRLVPGYRKGNDAEAKKTFVRLTPDRADKNGALWSRNALKSDQWTAVMKFRISGQGRTMFGDGACCGAVDFRTLVHWPLHFLFAQAWRYGYEDQAKV